MSNLVLAILFLFLAFGGVVVRKTYYYLPAYELKRRAEQNDRLASQLYRAVAYGNSLRGLLWLYIGLTTAAGLILLARSLHIWLSLLIVAPLLWIAFSFIPATHITRLDTGLTKLVTPIIARLLNYVHPLLDRSTNIVQRRYIGSEQTRLFEREDLLELIERQGFQTDNRLTDEELQIVRQALSFSDYKVSEILIPRKKIKTVLANDTVGPVLIDELHKSGQQHVLVRDKSKGQVIGTLAVGQLGLESSGKVRDLMDHTVYYLHQDDYLSDALHAFFVTNHSMFVVVNSFEEFVGIVTVGSMIHQLLGHIPGDDFDQYANLSAVAARHVHHKKSDQIDDKDQKPDLTAENMVK